MDKEVGERIRHVRLDKGYTRDTLSMMSGVSEKYIFQIERQHTGFSVDILLKLTKAFNTPQALAELISLAEQTILPY